MKQNNQQTTKRIRINGVVQAVGFRPFIYRKAIAHDLTGWVKNLGDAGVQIVVQGLTSQIENFLTDVKQNNPPLARVDSFSVSEISRSTEYQSFEIKSSSKGSTGSGTIPPDIGTCEDCLKEVFEDTRYRGYWATSCVNCGPRFSVIEELPYDRERTSLSDFPLCEDCYTEYTDPEDRRYHAQTIACPQCGPELWYQETGNEQRHDSEPLNRAAGALKRGKIIVIKGLGGSHLACDATDRQVVSKLRNRLNRSTQPFALMASHDTINCETTLTNAEDDLLTSPRRPIVILNKSEPTEIADNIAPGLHTVGFMLPYTALHHLLFDKLTFPLIMTSANRSGEPMAISNSEIKTRMEAIADGFLLHNRNIVSRCDDSVLRVSDSSPKFLRRSRGWVPQAIDIDLGPEPKLALGAEQDNVVGLYVSKKIYLSQYLGDSDSPENIDFLKSVVDRLLKLTNSDMPSTIAHDFHPDFFTTELAHNLGSTTEAIQHHHAHVGSVLAESNQNSAVVITLDGIGYGLDSNIWGGEVFYCNGESIQRTGKISNGFMPGGDLASRHPARMVAGILYPLIRSPEKLQTYIKSSEAEFPQGDRELSATISQLTTDLNCPKTSSAGRFLDAVSTLLGVCNVRSYEGEPAMKLESAAKEGKPLSLDPQFKKEDSLLVLDQTLLLKQLMELQEQHPTSDLAATAQNLLAEGMAELAMESAEKQNVKSIGLSGGVAYNDFIFTRIKQIVINHGYTFITNETVPLGDGGIALGQLWAVNNLTAN